MKHKHLIIYCTYTAIRLCNTNTFLSLNIINKMTDDTNQ